jgi:tripartite-type tricarboxylate transporter receptor subunit TctC
MRPISRRFMAMLIIAGAGISCAPATADNYFAGKTIALYAGLPPGGGIDAEMRLVAQFYGRFLPGKPNVVPMNMPGADGILLANHLHNIARPDGLTLGLPGRSGFVLAGLTGDNNARYDLSKLTWIGSSGAPNQSLWIRNGANVRSLSDLRAARAPLVIGGLSVSSSSVLVPLILAKYEKFPLRAIAGYPGFSELTLALQRDEIDGIFTVASSLSQNLIASGEVLQIMQSFPNQRGVPVIAEVIKNENERRVLDLVLGPARLGVPVVGPPGIPLEIVALLRDAYAKMVGSDEYRSSASSRGIEIPGPLSGEDLQAYVTNHLASTSPAALAEYLSYIGKK